MKERVHEFFEVLAKEWDQPAQVILIGAAAGALWGSVRPSQDVDFEIRMAHTNPSLEKDFEAAVQRTVKRTGLQANYGEEIGRWGMISLLSYREHTVPYRHFGKLKVCLLDPVYWAIGKLNRYTQSDVQDVEWVLRKKGASPEEAIRVWGRALRESPLSEAKLLFRKHVEHFLRAHGREIWGAKFDADAAVRAFRRRAGIKVE